MDATELCSELSSGFRQRFPGFVENTCVGPRRSSCHRGICWEVGDNSSSTSLYSINSHRLERTLELAHKNGAQFPGKEPQEERKRYSRKFQRMTVAGRETCEDAMELGRELGRR